mgnify:CR=1 FL=1
MATHGSLMVFKQVTRDAFGPFIEVTLGGKLTPKKGNKDKVEWTIVNHTSDDIEVAVVDFYAERGGTAFSSGFVPETSGKVDKKLAGGAPGTGSINRIRDEKGNPHTGIEADGDVGNYKYSVLARVNNTGPWILVKDPEMEIEL